MHSCTYVRAHTCALMCEQNLKDICPSVRACMHIGVYITLFVCVCAYMCGRGYVNTCNIKMMLVC